MRPVRDPPHEIVDAGSGFEISGADLDELVENLVPDLLPVPPQILLHLLRLLLLHSIPSTSSCHLQA